LPSVYIDRLTTYITWAKQNNIVVCLTLFNDYMLRVGPGHAWGGSAARRLLCEPVQPMS